MKKNIHSRYLLIILLLIFHYTNINAQVCGAGYIRDTLNWDALDFLPTTGSATTYITTAQSQLQRFSFATQKITITHNYTGSNAPGENGNNTAETSSFGAGDDVQFIGNGTITVTFQNPVQNVRFSLYDVDRGQRATITSTANVTLATLTGTILAISNNTTLSARVDAAGSTNVANNSNTPAANGTVNVSIPGPITTFTITIINTTTNGSEDGSFYLSDISACDNSAAFPTNYYNISKPFTGQPSYVLASRNDSVYYVNVANGVAKFLFADYGNTYINSMAYDPYRHFVYYTYSLSGPGGTVSSTDRILRRYDYDMDTLGVISTDVRNLGIPLYDQSIESGAAAFYNGSLYLGIEGGTGITDRESTIWKVDFSGTPTYAPLSPVTQVYASESDIHDWADIGINNGIIYDFDGSSGNEDFYHQNMTSGTLSHYNNTPSTLIPRQVGVDWQGNVYNIGSPSAIAAATIVPYTYNGAVNTAQQYNITFNGVAVTGSWGDAAEAFKPKTDYGDAPASYDPAGSDPATTEKDDSLRLGNSVGIEWTKHTSVDASGDGPEEDGLTGLQVISTGVSSYLISAKVYNHTGANATLCAWVDANGNGVFDATEGISVTVASSPTLQTVALNWPSINVLLPPLSTTFMRLRLTSTSNGMTTANPTGYFPNGEVEDYKVSVVVVLPDQKIELKAQKAGLNNVSLVWNVNDENGISKYELQRSSDGANWSPITYRATEGRVIAANYSFIDNDPDMPVSYFRVKVFKNSGAVFYSEVKLIDFNTGNSISVTPNPTNSTSKLNVLSAAGGSAHISILDFTGRIMFDETVKLVKGNNTIPLNKTKELSNGVYKVRVQLDAEVLISTLIIIK